MRINALSTSIILVAEDGDDDFKIGRLREKIPGAQAEKQYDGPYRGYRLQIEFSDLMMFLLK